MSSKNRKHSGRKRPSGEVLTLNRRKFEKMLEMAGDRGHTIIPHPDPRYYPKIIPHFPEQPKKSNRVKDAADRQKKASEEKLRGPRDPRSENS